MSLPGFKSSSCSELFIKKTRCLHLILFMRLRQNNRDSLSKGRGTGSTQQSLLHGLSEIQWALLSVPPALANRDRSLNRTRFLSLRLAHLSLWLLHLRYWLCSIIHHSFTIRNNLYLLLFFFFPDTKQLVARSLFSF